VAREVGRITYTQMRNARGGVECDVTVTRVAEELFWIVTGTAFGAHDRAWLTRHAPADGSVTVRDVTSAWSCFALWGPRARDVLAPVASQALDFGYMTMRDIAVGDVPVRALRVTYVGELGWELYCPAEYGAGLWRTLWAAGEEHGLAAGGYKAIDALRLEKGYRVWGADVTPDDTPAEAFGVGAAARRLRCLVLDDPRSVALGNEPVRVDGEIAGRVTSGGYGYAVARSIAYAYLPATVEVGAAVEVDVFGEWIGGRVAEEPLYDPAGERLRG
jgi:4-methylaminobutanoate oxidase (formaldehyde-forming)